MYIWQQKETLMHEITTAIKKIWPFQVSLVSLVKKCPFTKKSKRRCCVIQQAISKCLGIGDVKIICHIKAPGQGVKAGIWTTCYKCFRRTN